MVCGYVRRLPTEKVEKIDHIEAGRRIRDLREKSGMSLRRLAKEMGFTPPFISDLERGRRNWTPENFNKAKEIIGGSK